MPDEHNVKVLVVDDNAIKRYGVVRILRQAGFETIEATTGEEGLRLAAQKPDLVVLDVKLPDMSGFDVCRTIKSDPALSSIKVLHVSATFTDSDHRVAGLARGADGYLVQPVEPGELLETVRSLLRLREVEEISHRAAREWRATFDALSDGILVVDELGTVVRCNRAMASIAGRAVTEIVGLPYAEAFSPTVDPPVLPALFAMDAADRPQSIEVSFRDRHFTVTVDPMEEAEERMRGYVCVFTDITERKKLEEELRSRAAELAAADRAKDNFLAMLGHELRNPLGAVSNAAEILRMRAGDVPSIQKPLQLLTRQLGHMSRMVDDLLDVSRISRDKLTLQVTRLDLAVPARCAVETALPACQRAGHTLEFDAPHTAIWVEGDAARLEQVFGNLINNACKYTPAGGLIEVTVAQECGEAVVKVKDNGEGIAPEMLPIVFDLFAQEDRSLERSKGGLGIGLTLAKRFVEMHGGTISADSAGPGQGSEFTVRLPLPDYSGRPSDDPQEAPENRGPARRILIVDDNREAASTLQSILEAWGHEATVALDGPTALEAAAERKPDIVLLDIGLPGMDGYEVARRLRNGEASQGPVLVALTGYGQERDRRNALEAGFDHYMVKPVHMEALRTVLTAGTAM